MNKIREIIEEIIGHLVTYDDDLIIDEADIGRATTKFTIRMNAADFGKLLGKRSATFKAVRYLLERMAMGTGRAVVYELITPDDKTPKTKAPFQPDPEFDAAPFRDLLQRLASQVLKQEGVFEVQQSDDETSTTFELSVPRIYRSRMDDAERAPALPTSLDVLFQAMGRNSGRVINVTVAWK